MVPSTHFEPSQTHHVGSDIILNGVSPKRVPPGETVSEQTTKVSERILMTLLLLPQIPGSWFFRCLLWYFAIIAQVPLVSLYQLLVVPRMRALLRDYQEKGVPVTGTVVGQPRHVVTEQGPVVDVDMEYDYEDCSESIGLLLEEGENTRMHKTFCFTEEQFQEECHTSLLILPGKPKSAMPAWAIEAKLKTLTTTKSVVDAILEVLMTFLMPYCGLRFTYGETGIRLWLLTSLLGCAVLLVFTVAFFRARVFDTEQYWLLESGESVEPCVEGQQTVNNDKNSTRTIPLYTRALSGTAVFTAVVV